ncbi:MAG: CBS domain-containing protein [Candidatus Micrarchaeota archaeon]
MQLISPVETIDAGEMASKALRKLEDHKMLIVTNNGKYAGELHPALVLRFKANAEKVKIGKLARKGSIMLENEVRFQKVLEKFSGGDVKWIAVLDKNLKPIGIVDAAAVLQNAGEALAGITAAEFMDAVPFIEASTGADKAEELMLKKGVQEIAVQEKGKFLGLITARDIAVKVKPYLHKKLHDLEQREKINVERESVRSILTPEFEVKKAGSGEALFDALRNAQFGEVFVFDGPQLKGKVAYPKIMQQLKFIEPAHIEVSGLNAEEAMFKDSIFEECAALLRKFGKGGSLHLRVKSSLKGKGKKIYELHGRLEIDGKAFVCSTPGMKQHREKWALGMAVAEVLDELKKSYLKTKR